MFANPAPLISRLDRSERLVDVALGLTIIALNVAGVFLPDDSRYEYNEPYVPLALAIAVAPGAALVWRRSRPLFGMYVCLTAMVAVSLLEYRVGNLPASLLFASYAVGAWSPVRRGLIGLGSMHCLFIVFAVLRLPYFDEWIAFATPVIFTLPWILGAAIRRKRLEGEHAIQRALQLEREKTIATQRAVAEERLRMARELHDVVTHTLSIIAVQSGVARHLLPPSERSGGVADALEVIETSSRGALEDLRRMLGLLRGEHGEGLVPSPGLQELDILAASHRVTHGPLQLEVDPLVDQVSPGLRLTVFRLVQEALTNVGKHAPGAAARVSVRSSLTGVVVEVENESSTHHPPAGDGYGMAGMRERVALYGGTLDAGPAPDGGFRVRAELHQSGAR